jgi:spore maturation protein CgeB
MLRDEQSRAGIGEAGRRRVLTAHTAAHRAAELEGYISEVTGVRTSSEVPIAALG